MQAFNRGVHRFLIATSVALGSEAAHDLAAQVSPPVPSVEDVISRLKVVEDFVETLCVTCLSIDYKQQFAPDEVFDEKRLRQLGFLVPDEVFDEKLRGQLGLRLEPHIPNIFTTIDERAEIVWEVTRDGVGQAVATLERKSLRFDGEMIGERMTATATCDGKGGRWLETHRQRDGVKLGDDGIVTHNLSARHINPFDLSTHGWSIPFSQLIRDRDVAEVRVEEIDGRSVLFLKLTPRERNQEGLELWVDMERGVVPRRQDNSLHMKNVVEAGDYSEVAPGIWLPARASVLSYAKSAQRKEYVAHRARCIMTGWAVNKRLDAKNYDVDYPPDKVE